MVLYHVTKLTRVVGIMRRGILPAKDCDMKRNWSNRFGSPMGYRDRIYAFDDLMTAYLWAAKMQFDLDCGASVVSFVAEQGVWFPESPGPVLHSMYKIGTVKPDQIMAAWAITPRMVARAMKRGRRI